MNAVQMLSPMLVKARAWIAPILGPVAGIHARAMTITGWINGEDARAMVRETLALPDNPVIVEIGVFMGRSTALLAGARRLRGNGRVYSVDPFDCSGDAYSISTYREELKISQQISLESAFVKNVSRLGLMRWVEIRRGSSSSVARDWTLPIDLLLLDADYTAHGAKAIFDEWMPFLKVGGVLMLPNSADRDHPEGHDGNRRLVDRELHRPRFSLVVTINDLTIAKTAQ